MEIRTIGKEDVHGFLTAAAVGFLNTPELGKEEVEHFLNRAELDRTWGVFDGDRCVATYRSFSHEVTVVGGAPVTSNAVSAVTVSPSHRRRGLLSRLITADLLAAKERGEAMSSLIAAEYPIYGRFGFGPSAHLTEWQIEVLRAKLGPRPEGQVSMAGGAEIREHGPAVHDRLRAKLPGMINRTELWWRKETGDIRLPSQPWKEPFHAIYRSPSGEVDGFVTYKTDDVWVGSQPEVTATVQDLIAATPEAEYALWHFMCSIDWVTKLKTGDRAPDDIVPLVLGDPRSARIVSQADFLWLRVLDVPQLMETRTYPTSDDLVLHVHDENGLAGGTFLLEATPEGATCGPTTRSADLSLTASDLAALYLGDESTTRLASLGRVKEETPRAASRADLLLRTPRRPWCPDEF